MTKYLANRLP